MDETNETLPAATLRRLRPIERRVTHWSRLGLGDDEIATMFRRTSRWVANVRYLSGLDRVPRPVTSPGRLRAIERCVLRWRDGGADYAEIGRRFGRSAGAIARIEGFGRDKLAVRTRELGPSTRSD